MTDDELRAVEMMQRAVEEQRRRLAKARELADVRGDEDWTTLAARLAMIRGVCAGELPV